MNNLAAQTIHLLIFCTLLLALGCAPKPKQSETKLNLLPSMNISGINMSGGAIIYGQNSNGDSFGKIFDGSGDRDAIVIPMDYGTWDFAIFTYAGPNALEGTLECGQVSGVNIKSEKEVVDIKIGTGFCDLVGARKMRLARCSNAQFTAGNPLACSQITGFDSYRVLVNGFEGLKPSGGQLESRCYLSSDFMSGDVPFVPQIPTGVGVVRKMPSIVQAYASADCSGAPKVIRFNPQISKPNRSGVKVAPSGGFLYYMVDNDDPGLDASIPNVTITGSTAIPDAVNTGYSWVGSTNNSPFAVNGNCSEIGDPVSFYVDSTLVGTATCTGGGTYASSTIDLTGQTDMLLGQDARIFEARQTNASSNVGTSSDTGTSLVLTFDTTPPSASTLQGFSSPGLANYIVSTTPTITINKGADSFGFTSKLYQIRRYGDACISAPTVVGLTEPTGATTGPQTLVDGNSYYFSILTEDYAGNQTVSGCFGPYIVDATPPTVVLGPTSAFAGSDSRNWINGNNAASFGVQGSCEAGLAVSFFIDGVATGDTATCPGGSFTSSIDLSLLADTGTSSSYSLEARQTDLAGNLGSSPGLTLHKDTVAPPAGTISAVTPTPNGFNKINTINPTVGASTVIDSAPGSGVEINRIRQHAGVGCLSTQSDNDSAGTTYAPTLVDGNTYSFQVQRVDVAGNTSGFSACYGVPVIVDTTAPLPATGLSWVQASPTADDTPTAQWTASTSTDVQSQDVNIFPNDNCTPTATQTVSTTSIATSHIATSLTSGVYSFQITTIDEAGNSSDVCTTVPSALSVDTIGPNLATISDFSVTENSAITTVNLDDTSGGDTDGTGDTLSYTCTFDTTVDGAVAAGTNCTSLPNSLFSFNTGTGSLDWTPDFTATGAGSTDYEIRIQATEGNSIARTDDEVFVATVNNLNQAPLLAQPNHQLIRRNDPLNLNFDNSVTGNDTDPDNGLPDVETITYSCFIDSAVDQTVLNTTTCNSIPNLTFDPNTGAFDWVNLPANNTETSFEVKIGISDGIDQDEKIFIINTYANNEVVNAQLPSLKVWLKSDPKFLYSDTAGTTLVPGPGSPVRGWRNAIPDGSNPPLVATAPNAPQAPNFQGNPPFTAKPTLNWNRANNNRLILPDDPFYSATTEVSVVIYAHKSLDPGPATFFYRKGNATGDRSYGLYTGGSESLVGEADDSLFATQLVNSAGTWQAGQTKCIIFTIDATTHNVYEGNTLLDQNVGTGGYLQNSEPLAIGNASVGNSALNGAIAEMQIYDVVLNGTQRANVCTQLSNKYD